jgi:hypothetical protein
LYINRILALLIFVVSSAPSLVQALTVTVTTTGTAATLTYVGNATGWAITDCNTNASGVLNIPSSISGFNVTEIGSNAFQSCSSLTSVTIPNSVTVISDSTQFSQGAFYGCTSLTSVTIPSSVTTIGGSAFQSCSSLTSVTIPNSVTSIGYDAFRDCRSLASVTILSSVTTIGGSAFQSCSSLTSVTISNSVTSIGYDAFRDCTALTDFVIPDRFVVALARIGVPDALGSQILMEATEACVAANNPVLNEALIDALAADDAFLLALAQRVAAQNAAVYATKVELASYATKAQITDATLGGLATGINTVTSHPDSWSLFNWTTYKTNAEELTGFPTDIAFVRIKLRK